MTTTTTTTGLHDFPTSPEDFAEALYAAGWKAPMDAQHEKVTLLYHEMVGAVKAQLTEQSRFYRDSLRDAFRDKDGIIADLREELATTKAELEEYKAVAVAIDDLYVAAQLKVDRLEQHFAGTPAAHVEKCFQLAKDLGRSQFSSEPPIEYVQRKVARLTERLSLVHAYILAEWRANRLSSGMSDKLIDSLNQSVEDTHS